MRRGLLGVTVVAVLAPGVTTAAGPAKATVELRSDLLVSGLPLAECAKGVYGIRLTAQVDKKGEGSGTLELDPNAPAYDEFGFQATGGNLPPVKLECTLKFIKKKTFRLPASPRIAAPLVEVEWVLFEVRGPKVTSRLFLATEDKAWGSWARLLVHDKDGKVRYVVPVRTPPPPPPCHPGCFPAGTPVRVPGGTKPIERVREGDRVTTIGADGKPSSAQVTGVFGTRNRLLEVRTEGGTLVTTETQPIALEGGGFRPAGELKAGDRVWRWVEGKRRAVAVRGASAAGREAEVFNLVLGEPQVFVAGDFLVRSKPPAVQARPGVRDAGAVAPADHGRR
jgi:hypothetical protein